MTILETKRLKLIPFCDEHLAGLTAINSDPEVMTYIGNGAPMSEAESQSNDRSRKTEMGFARILMVECFP